MPEPELAADHRGRNCGADIVFDPLQRTHSGGVDARRSRHFPAFSMRFDYRGDTGDQRADQIRFGGWIVHFPAQLREDERCLFQI
ncbi:hypothetical protein ACFZC5_34805, partial [Nocardia gamkensis]|uniref:hypothetical protein n=1 Tax=Nocardia gamkensis TaxID=352869 RepID=UPI0036F0ACC2